MATRSRNLLAFVKMAATPGARKALALLTALTGAAPLASVACRRSEVTFAPAERSASMRLDTVAPTAVSGALNGRRFEAREVWFRVQRKSGRERIDLIISEGRAARLCAESDPDMSRHVWLRFPGWQRFERGEYRIDPAARGAFSVHYEESPDDRLWSGRAVASAMVSIDSTTSESVVGRLRVCFGDATHSCLSGSFRALECRSELDPDGPRAGNIRRSVAADGGAEP